jgi:TPR repeat protein
MGKGVPRDTLEAARWFRAAVAAGDAGAWADRFSMVLAGHADSGERAQVIRWLLAEAKAGDAGALFKLGLCRAHNDQGRIDTALARFYFITAARDGLADAAAAAGEMLVNGRGGPADLPQGVALLRQAAQDGHAGANYALGVLFSDRDALHRAADAGHAGARVRLEQRVPA